MCVAVEPDSGPPGPRAWGLAHACLAAPCLQAGLRAGLWAGVGHLLWVVAAGQALMPGPSFSVLQVLGFEIDAVNSVQFSNHTGKVLAQLRVGMRRGPLERWGSPHLTDGEGAPEMPPHARGRRAGVGRSAGVDCRVRVPAQRLWTGSARQVVLALFLEKQGHQDGDPSTHPRAPPAPRPRLPLALGLQVTLWPRGGPRAAGGRGCALLVSARDQCLEEPVGVSVHRDSKAFWAQKP